jgi:ABC-type Fe3+ transport system substrate-binding protein
MKNPLAVIAALCIQLFSWHTAAAESLTIISPHWEGIRYEFGRAFSAHYRQRFSKEVEISWLDVGGTSEILRYIRSEYQRRPDSIGIDLIFGGGVDPFIELKRAALLERPALALGPAVAREAAGTPLHDLEGYFFAPTMSVFGIICNQVVLKRLHLETPRTWEDLGAPALKSWIGSGDPRRSGSMHMAYEIMLQAYGWERGWQAIYRLGANIRSFAANSLQVSKDVGNGEVACGLAIDSQASSQIKAFGRDNLSFIVPDGLTVLNGDSIALLKGAPNRDVAVEFLRFLFTEEGQRLWMLPTGSPGGPVSYELGRLAVMPHLYDDRPRAGLGINPFLQHTSLRYDTALGSARWTLLNDLIGVFIVDNQAALRQQIPPHAPIPEENVLRLASALGAASPIDRAKLIHSWEHTAHHTSTSERLLQAAPLLLIAIFLLVGAMRRHRRAPHARETAVL